LLTHGYYLLYDPNNYRPTDDQVFSISQFAIANLGIWVGGYTLILFLTLLPTFLTMKYDKAYRYYVNIILLLVYIPLN